MAQAAFWFSLMAMFVKLAGRSLPPMQIVCVRACFTLLVTSLLLRRIRGQARLLGHRRGLLLLRGALGSGGLMCFYFAVVHLPMAEATVIHQMSPLFTALLAGWLLGERLEGRVLTSIVISLCGVLAIARPGWLTGAAADVDAGFVLVALAGSLFAAGAYITVRHLGRSEHPYVVVFYFPLVTVPLTAPFAATQWVWPDPMGWVWLLGVGATTQLAQLALTKGLARERAGRATSVGYLQVAFATVLGAVFFDSWPDLMSLLGILLILLGLFVGTRPGRYGAVGIAAGRAPSQAP